MPKNKIGVFAEPDQIPQFVFTTEQDAFPACQKTQSSIYADLLVKAPY
jgi:hypothetical protein